MSYFGKIFYWFCSETRLYMICWNSVLSIAFGYLMVLTFQWLLYWLFELIKIINYKYCKWNSWSTHQICYSSKIFCILDFRDRIKIQNLLSLYCWLSTKSFRLWVSIENSCLATPWRFLSTSISDVFISWRRLIILSSMLFSPADKNLTLLFLLGAV